MNKTSFIVSLAAACLLLGIFWVMPNACQARTLARSQRQAITSELATGLTGTGTSFNSLYSDPFMQQNIYNNGYDDLYGRTQGNRNSGFGYGGLSGNRYDYNNINNNNNNNNLNPYDPTTNIQTGGWTGFGAGYGGRAYGKGRSSIATSGIKY